MTTRREQVSQFMRRMVQRNRETGNVQGKLGTIGGRECMEGSAQHIAAPWGVKEEAAREFQGATGRPWQEVNDNAATPSEVYADVEKVAESLAPTRGREKTRGGREPRRATSSISLPPEHIRQSIAQAEEAANEPELVREPGCVQTVPEPVQRPSAGRAPVTQGGCRGALPVASGWGRGERTAEPVAAGQSDLGRAAESGQIGDDEGRRSWAKRWTQAPTRERAAAR